MSFILVKETAEAIVDSAVQSGSVYDAMSDEDAAALTACAAEVRVLLQGAWANIIKIGGVLKEAKTHCAYGAWGKWVETECGFSQKTASRYMNVYDRFSGNEKVLALPGSLSYALLGVPDEEEVNELAEKAAEEGWSERQLKQEIARRKEAEKRAQEAEAEIESTVQTARELEQELRAENGKIAEKLRAANERSDAFAQNLTDAQEEMTRLHTELAAARRAAGETKIVEKCVEVYPMDYDQVKEEAKNYKGVSLAQQEEIAQLRKELEKAKAEAAKSQEAETKMISAAQFGDAVTMLLSYIADAMRMPFDAMPARTIGEYMDHIERVERFCADLRSVIEG